MFASKADFSAGSMVVAQPPLLRPRVPTQLLPPTGDLRQQAPRIHVLRVLGRRWLRGAARVLSFSTCGVSGVLLGGGPRRRRLAGVAGAGGGWPLVRNGGGLGARLPRPRRPRRAARGRYQAALLGRRPRSWCAMAGALMWITRDNSIGQEGLLSPLGLKWARPVLLPPTLTPPIPPRGRGRGLRGRGRWSAKKSAPENACCVVPQRAPHAPRSPTCQPESQRERERQQDREQA